jgi:diguanylate cyclase (GGDEF)-like protein
MASFGRAFVSSKIGKKIFLTFLLIVAVPLIAISLLSREISEYVLTKTTDQLLRDSTKFVSLSLIDRMRNGEAILKILHHSRQGANVSPDALERSRIIFAEVKFGVKNDGAPGGVSRINVVSNPNSVLQDVQIVVPDRESNTLTVGTVNPDYLWENLESAFYTLCVGGAQWREPHCHGPSRPEVATVENHRSLYFRPYLDGEPWTLLAVAAPNIVDYLPVKLGAIFAYTAALSLLLALSVSALFIRRATTPLEVLIKATNAIRHGDFSHQIRLDGMKDEFAEVAESFNVMSTTIGADISLLKTLAAMDEAILERQSLGTIIRLGLGRLAEQDETTGLAVHVFSGPVSPSASYRIAGPGEVAHVPFGLLENDPGNKPEAGASLVARTETLAVFMQRPAGLKPGDAAERDLAAIRSRIAIAVNSAEHEKVLRTRAARDSLTRLLNRLGLVEQLDKLIASRTSAQPELAIVYLDLDGFKEVNDAYGHDVGDRLLKLVADRIAASLESQELAIARMGGDEFVFVLPVDLQGQYKNRISTVLHDLQHLFRIDELQIKVGASLGVALFPRDGENHGDLLKCADLAMYAAKSNGRNQAVYFESSLNSAAAERIELRRDLGFALGQNQFYVVYQPRVSCSDLSHGSAEALIRWQHPVRGNIPPDHFITLAEESGQIIDIGYWVLAEAAGQIRAWQQQGNRQIERVSVNISPIQLMTEDFLVRVEKIITDSGISPACIELEVTEGALIKDIGQATQKLSRLREFGLAVALDDFGVGYSAMSYLSVLPFDTLKIDKSFVNGIGNDASAFAIASAIVALGKALGKNIVAEGVETQQQADILIGLGVDELQGYLYSRPLRPTDLEKFLGLRYS